MYTSYGWELTNLLQGQDEDGKEEFDEDLVCYDFSNWWDNMDDIEQVKEYRKHE